MLNIATVWEQLVDCICRPPRDIYPADALLGGPSGVFRILNCKGYREDFEILNKKGQKLKCSHFKPGECRNNEKKYPCVIYCHCNSGSRRDAEEAIWTLLPLGVSIVALDFSGSGLSEGDWVTLGANEVEDLDVLVKHMRKEPSQVSTIGLWGRSMGAVTALMYSARDPSMAGMVLDSPFSRLTDLMMEIVNEQKMPIPRPLMKMAVSIMKRSVSKRASFDLTKVAPIDMVAQSFVPVLFGHSLNDHFIKLSHSEALLEAYAGDKNLIKFEGDHNSRRPDFFYHSISIFFCNTLQLDAPPSPSAASSSPFTFNAPPRTGASAGAEEDDVTPDRRRTWFTGGEALESGEEFYRPSLSLDEEEDDASRMAERVQVEEALRRSLLEQYPGFTPASVPERANSEGLSGKRNGSGHGVSGVPQHASTPSTRPGQGAGAGEDPEAEDPHARGRSGLYPLSPRGRPMTAPSTCGLEGASRDHSFDPAPDAAAPRFAISHAHTGTGVDERYDEDALFMLALKLSLEDVPSSPTVQGTGPARGGGGGQI